MKDDSFLDIIKEVDPNYSNDIATTGFIDTGCYTLNALISGSLYGGMPNNRITGFAGEQATGKCVRGNEKIRIYTDEENYTDYTYSRFFDIFDDGTTNDGIMVHSDIYVKTPEGNLSKIHQVIKKTDHNIVRLRLENGTFFECSKGHVFSVNGKNILAGECTEVQLADGSIVKVEKVIPLGVEDVFDIGIDAPHLYISHPDNNIIHHNTYFALTAVKSFLDNNKDGRVVYFDTEFALDKEFFRKRGIDAERVIIIQPDTLETFRTMSSKILTKYGEQKEDERPKLMLVLDSLGNLPSNKEVEDADEGKNVRDMTKTQIIKSIFRILTQKIGKLNVPMIVTNHVYAVIGCLTEGQMVRMHDGSLKDISDITVGDEVLSENNTVKKVIQTHEYMTEEVYEIEMEDGYVMNCSPKHKFMTKNGWKEAEKLDVEDILMLA